MDALGSVDAPARTGHLNTRAPGVVLRVQTDDDVDVDRVNDELQIRASVRQLRGVDHELHLCAAAGSETHLLEARELPEGPSRAASADAEVELHDCRSVPRPHFCGVDSDVELVARADPDRDLRLPELERRRCSIQIRTGERVSPACQVSG